MSDQSLDAKEWFLTTDFVFLPLQPLTYNIFLGSMDKVSYVVRSEQSGTRTEFHLLSSDQKRVEFKIINRLLGNEDLQFDVLDCRSVSGEEVVGSCIAKDHSLKTSSMVVVDAAGNSLGTVETNHKTSLIHFIFNFNLFKKIIYTIVTKEGPIASIHAGKNPFRIFMKLNRLEHDNRMDPRLVLGTFCCIAYYYQELMRETITLFSLLRRIPWGKPGRPV